VDGQQQSRLKLVEQLGEWRTPAPVLPERNRDSRERQSLGEVLEQGIGGSGEAEWWQVNERPQLLRPVGVFAGELPFEVGPPRGGQSDERGGRRGVDPRGGPRPRGRGGPGGPLQ